MLLLRQDQEQARLVREIAHLQTELARIQAELARTWARVHAWNRYIFTLTFVGGQVALLEVRGAADQEQAYTIASQAIKTCSYSVADGDQTAGNAHCFYYWCSDEAQMRAR